MIRLPRMLSYVVLAGSLTLPAPLALYAQEADDAAAQEKAADEKAAAEGKTDAAAEPADAAAEPRLAARGAANRSEVSVPLASRLAP